MLRYNLIVSESNPTHISSVGWSKTRADIGEEVTLTANLVSIKDGTQISFIISEYSGKPPRSGGGEETQITTLSASAKGGNAEVKWKVIFQAENSSGRGLPEYRFRAKKGSEAGVVSKLLKLGSVTAVDWIEPATDGPLASGVESTQAYFKNVEKVKARATVAGLKGFKVKFTVLMKNPKGSVTQWEPVFEKENVSLQSGKAEMEFGLSKSELKSRAFASFRCEILLTYDASKATPSKYRSGYARHYTARLGIWGLGPSGPAYSNNVIIQVSDQICGIAIGRLNEAGLKRIAQQVAPDETDFKIFGYSRGGVSLATVCRELGKRQITVPLAIGIDPVSGSRSKVVIPDNIISAICYYQRNGAGTWVLPGAFGKGDAYSRKSGGESGITNILVVKDSNQEKVYHVGMPSYIVEEKNLVGDLQ